MDSINPIVDAKVAESANAAAVSKEADQNAMAVQISAAVDSSISKFFDRGVKERKYIDVGRIPFICDDIRGIHTSLADLKEKQVTREDFLLIKNIVFGFVGLICIAFMGALFTLVFIH